MTTSTRSPLGVTVAQLLDTLHRVGEQVFIDAAIGPLPAAHVDRVWDRAIGAVLSGNGWTREELLEAVEAQTSPAWMERNGLSCL